MNEAKLLSSNKMLDILYKVLIAIGISCVTTLLSYIIARIFVSTGVIKIVNHSIESGIKLPLALILFNILTNSLLMTQSSKYKFLFYVLVIVLNLLFVFLEVIYTSVNDANGIYLYIDYWFYKKR